MRLVTVSIVAMSVTIFNTAIAVPIVDVNSGYTQPLPIAILLRTSK